MAVRQQQQVAILVVCPDDDDKSRATFEYEIMMNWDISSEQIHWCMVHGTDDPLKNLPLCMEALWNYQHVLVVYADRHYSPLLYQKMTTWSELGGCVGLRGYNNDVINGVYTERCNNVDGVTRVLWLSHRHGVMYDRSALPRNVNREFCAFLTKHSGAVEHHSFATQWACFLESLRIPRWVVRESNVRMAKPAHLSGTTLLCDARAGWHALMQQQQHHHYNNTQIIVDSVFFILLSLVVVAFVLSEPTSCCSNGISL